MGQNESYDPRTWRDGIDYARAARNFPPLVSERASRVGLALSVAILIGGAVLAYASRSDAPAPVASAAN